MCKLVVYYVRPYASAVSFKARYCTQSGKLQHSAGTTINISYDVQRLFKRKASSFWAVAIGVDIQKQKNFDVDIIILNL